MSLQGSRLEVRGQQAKELNASGCVEVLARRVWQMYLCLWNRSLRHQASTASEERCLVWALSTSDYCSTSFFSKIISVLQNPFWKKIGLSLKVEPEKNEWCFSAVLPLSKKFSTCNSYCILYSYRKWNKGQIIQIISHTESVTAISQISLHPRGCFRQTESFITSPVCKKNEWFLGKAELEGFSLEWTYLGKNVLAF